MNPILPIQTQLLLSEPLPEKTDLPAWFKLCRFPDPWHSFLEPVLPQITAIPAPTRNRGTQKAFILRLAIPQETVEGIFPGVPTPSATLLFQDAIAEKGWEIVPRASEIAYLYGFLVNDELHSWLKFDLGIRHYRSRNQLLPNITRKLRRFVILYPDLLSHLDESFPGFTTRCYVLSRVVQRIAGEIEPLEELARRNGLPLDTPEDVLQFLEKLAGQTVRLSSGVYQLEPVDWPIHPPDLRTTDQNLSGL